MQGRQSAEAGLLMAGQVPSTPSSETVKGCARAVGIVFALALVSLVIWSGQDKEPRVPKRVAAAAPKQIGLSSKKGERCGIAGTVTQVDFAVQSETILLTQPAAGADPVPLQVGTESLPAPLELSASARELCRDGDWSEVYVASYPYGQLQGWVPSSALRSVPVTEAGRRIYRASDFIWPDGSGPAKSAVVTIANRIMDQRSVCLAIDTENLVMAGSGPAAVFSLPCFARGDIISFDFRAADAGNGRRF